MGDQMDISQMEGEDLVHQGSQSDELLVDTHHGHDMLYIDGIDGAENPRLQAADDSVTGDDLSKDDYNAEGNKYPTPNTHGGSDAEIYADQDAGFRSESEHATERESDKDAMSKPIPDFTEMKIAEIPQLIALYDAYASGYSDLSASPESHMQRAGELARAMLQHYYPASLGFSVEEESFEMMAGHGWNFWVPPAQVGKKKLVWNECRADYHKIPPAHIAGFVVKQTYTMTADDGSTYNRAFPHTYLAIMIDDLSTMHTWAPDSVHAHIPRGDLLAFSLGYEAKIRVGYGILLFGPRIEFYNFDVNAKNEISKMKGANWAMDMRDTDLASVNVMFKGVSERDVYYLNGVVGRGPRKGDAQA